MSTLVKLFPIVLAALFLTLVLGPDAPANAEVFDVTNLVTDDQSVNAAQLTDPHLKNAWGIAHSSMSPFWVSANGAGLAVLYNVNPTTNVTSKLGLEVTIPGAGNVTGQAFNSAGSPAFNGDAFLFVSEDGTVSGWRGALGNAAETLQLASDANVYKGTTQVMVGGHAYLLSANFRAGTIDVLKGEAGSPDLAGHFTDPNLPSGFAPFNVQVLGGKIYVAYAQQDAAKHDDVAGAGHGFVTEFDTNG
ncbi:MAG: TIGR03118 family protein, partial [Candidatus Rokuibacteriota bacterium]